MILKNHLSYGFILANGKLIKKAPVFSVVTVKRTATFMLARYNTVLSESVSCSAWQVVWEVSTKDEAGNAIIGDAHIIESSNDLVHSQAKLTTLIDVNNIAVVATRDAVLLTSRDNAESIKKIVVDLEEKGRTEANEALQIFRSWGNYEQLNIGEGYQVKRIVNCIILIFKRLEILKSSKTSSLKVTLQAKVEYPALA